MASVVGMECPPDVVDRLLWRNAQAVLRRHERRRDGECVWCGRKAPCMPWRLAERADAVSRLPWHEARSARDDITRLLPVLAADVPDGRAAHGRNQRRFT